MKVAVVSCNLGGFEAPVSHVPQMDVETDLHLFTDATFPPRSKAMTPRLQAKIPKMFAWDLRPGYDAYLWLDASFRLSQPNSVAWFLEQMGDETIAVFRHPWRQTAREEADFLRVKAAKGSRYILSRYDGEDLDGQMQALSNAQWYQDDRFFAAGCFCYRPGTRIQLAMKEWWYHTSRFHCIDQLSFPYALAFGCCTVNVIDQDIYHASHIEWMRGRHG